MTQHLLPNTTIQGEKYRIEQKPRYLKVFLSNSADSEIVRNRISLLHTVNNVNVTNPHTGDITVHHSTNKANAEMEKDVENTLRTYYSVTSGNDIALMHTKHLLGLLKRNSQEYLQLKTAINSFENDEFRHAFDDYRLCLEYYMRTMFGNNKTLENQIDIFREKMRDKGFSLQLRNLLDKGFDYFCKYQNVNVKHYNNISLIDTMTIFTWGNMLLEQMMYLNKMLNWNKP